MTCSHPNEPHLTALSSLDLSELMSQIVSDGKQGQRLVFVEYDPATRAFYDHVGLPKQDRDPVIKRFAKAQKTASSWKHFLEQISHDVGMAPAFRTRFPEQLADITNILLKYLFHTDCEDKERTGEDTRKVFLSCIARSHKETNADDTRWLKALNGKRLYDLFHWLIQRVPQPRGSGGAGRREGGGWKPVDNDIRRMKQFPELAGLEYVFGMRKATEMMHARFNVFLETGEYAGQMIAFYDASTREEKTELLRQSVNAARLVRRILPEVRQARYVDAILSGGEGGDIDHVLVRHMPFLVPIQRLYVRICDDSKAPLETWTDFFAKEATIFKYAASNKRKDFFGHFKSDVCSGASTECQDIRAEFEAHLNGCLPHKREGFLWPDLQGQVLLGFVTEESIPSTNGIAVLAVIDKQFLPGSVFAKGQWADKKPHYEWLKAELPGNYDEVSAELFSSQLSGTALTQYVQTLLTSQLAIVLQPRKPICRRLKQAQHRGRTYQEQYGNVIYGEYYLDVDSHRRRANADFRKIVGFVRDTRDRLADPLYLPLGYRAIARIIFDEFFCRFWHTFAVEDGTDPAIKEVNAKNYTPLGSLVREALDFEDTLRLDGGYREHFVHSYHVFLLGLVVMEKLGLARHMDTEGLIAWFMAAMYHDIAYPIQKIDDISDKYLKKLDPGAAQWAGVGDRLKVDLRVGYGPLVGSGLLGIRLKMLTDRFIRELFEVDTDKARHGKRVQEWLNGLPGAPGMETYRDGVQESFFQYCLRIALNDGEHGILSALLLENCARRSRLWRKPSLRRVCERACVAILSHHSLDIKKAKWMPSDRWSSFGIDRSELGSIGNASAKELVIMLGFAQRLFSYDIGGENKYRHLVSMLIVCDTLAQWGRSRDVTDRSRAYLRNPETLRKDLMVALCYPGEDIDKVKQYREDFYEPQLNTIASSSSSKDLVGITCRCDVLQTEGTLSAERCRSCTKAVWDGKAVMLDDKVTPYDKIVGDNCEARKRTREEEERNGADHVRP